MTFLRLAGGRQSSWKASCAKVAMLCPRYTNSRLYIRLNTRANSWHTADSGIARWITAPRTLSDLIAPTPFRVTFGQTPLEWNQALSFTRFSAWKWPSDASPAQGIHSEAGGVSFLQATFQTTLGRVPGLYVSICDMAVRVCGSPTKNA